MGSITPNRPLTGLPEVYISWLVRDATLPLAMGLQPVAAQREYHIRGVVKYNLLLRVFVLRRALILYT